MAEYDQVTPSCWPDLADAKSGGSSAIKSAARGGMATDEALKVLNLTKQELGDVVRMQKVRLSRHRPSAVVQSRYSSGCVGLLCSNMTSISARMTPRRAGPSTSR